MPQTYADQVVDWLVEEGYDTCFFLAGGNIMHLLNSARSRVTCVPVVHEVAAGIAAEYFNATRPSGAGKAFALVTAGPGVTNILTAMAGAFLESRELLVIAGQVKSTDLSGPDLRQRGIQEVDACALAAPVSKATLQITAPRPKGEILEVVRDTSSGRPGPALIDFCLDAQAAPPLADSDEMVTGPDAAAKIKGVCSSVEVSELAAMFSAAERPIVLIGGGVSRDLARVSVPRLEALGLPVATTWNALDRIADDSPVYFGRPDTWGMRWANVLLQQADLVVAVGARLSLQQTGFNWQAFAPLADVVHVDVDVTELEKVHPVKSRTLQCTAESLLPHLLDQLAANPNWTTWREFAQSVRKLLPLNDPSNETGPGFISPYTFVEALSQTLGPDDILVPCSSGGASTVLMQAFRQKRGQLVLNDKALASMGYGLSGAIGAALANPHRRVTLVEGDGGFAQNLQELGTVRAQSLKLKMFIYDNRGYASIRMTQRNYFDGAYVGCDEQTGVGFPDWAALASAYGIPSHVLDPAVGLHDPTVKTLLEADGPAFFIVPVDPEQTYYPKITSRVTASGTMESNPLHLMTPDLTPELTSQVMPYLEVDAR